MRTAACSADFGTTYPTPDEAEQLELLRSSPLFDAGWYLRAYHDVVRSGDEPALHFLRNAVNPFRSPSADFDTARYVEDHPEVLDLGINPLVHFLLTPRRTGRGTLPARRAESMGDPEDFQRRWHGFVRRWGKAGPRWARPLVSRRAP